MARPAAPAHARTGAAGRLRRARIDSREAAPLPGNRLLVALVPARPRLRGVPGRRHGPGQDASDARLPRTPAHPGPKRGRPRPRAARRARIAFGKLGTRAAEVRSRPGLPHALRQIRQGHERGMGRRSRRRAAPEASHAVHHDVRHGAARRAARAHELGCACARRGAGHQEPGSEADEDAQAARSCGSIPARSTTT